MPYYFYDIYTVVTTYKYTASAFTASRFSIKYADKVYSSYTFNATTGLFSTASASFGRLGYEDYYQKGYVVSSDFKTVYYAVYNRSNDTITVTQSVSVQSIASQTKGSLTNSNGILDQTYPTNGVLSNKWYVRKTALVMPPTPVILTGQGQTAIKLKSEKEQLKVVWAPLVEPNQLNPQYLVQYKNLSGTWVNMASFTGAGFTERAVSLTAAMLGILDKQPLEVRVGFGNTYDTSYSQSVFIILEKDKQAIQIDNKLYMINSELQWQEVLHLDETDDTLIAKITRQNKESKTPIILKEGWDNMAVFSQKINLKKHKDLIKIKVTPVTQPSTP